MSRKTREDLQKRLTPRQAIRQHCVDCVGNALAVRDCQGNELFDSPCLFHPYRIGIGRPSVKLIRKFCLYCMGGRWKLVKECPSKACSFLRYRMGKNPAMPNRRAPFIFSKRPRHGAIFAQESTNSAALISDFKEDIQENRYE